MENSVAYLTIVFYLLILLIVFFTFFEWKKYSKRSNAKTQINIALGLGFIFLLLSFLAPKLFIASNSLFNFSESTAHIGDSLAIMNPFIAITGVIFTFLAFYIQKLANDEIKAQFKKQQFESQFFEMLHLHKENVNELSITDFLDENDNIEKKGRHVFFIMSKIFEKILGYSKNYLATELTIKNFEESYHIFFWGIKNTDEVEDQLSKKLLGQGAYSGINIGFGLFKNYQGLSYSLGHYFRHLFLTVKFVIDSNIITEQKEKMKYLKILRAQLSNHEQIMLFYNWLSGYGEAWEDDENSFFTDFKMIHNLWNEQLFQDQYIVDTVNELIDKYNTKYGNIDGHKPLFEFQGDNFYKKMKDISIITLKDL